MFIFRYILYCKFLPLKKWVALLPLGIVWSFLLWMTNKTASLPDLLLVMRKKGNKLLLTEELHYMLGQIKTNENTVQRCMSNKNNPAGSYLPSAGQDTVLRT